MLIRSCSFPIRKLTSPFPNLTLPPAPALSRLLFSVKLLKGLQAHCFCFLTFQPTSQTPSGIQHPHSGTALTGVKNSIGVMPAPAGVWPHLDIQQLWARPSVLFQAPSRQHHAHHLLHHHLVPMPPKFTTPGLISLPSSADDWLLDNLFWMLTGT